MTKPILREWILALAVILTTASVHGQQVALGNLLVLSRTGSGSTAYTIREYGPDGTLVQELRLEQPPGQTDNFHGRDLALGPDGKIHVFNGTFDPYLSSYDPVANTWSHITTPGWSTANLRHAGGLAVFGNTVFVTDMTTSGDESGVIAFDIATGVAQRFAESMDPLDLTIGLDGKLYVMGSDNVRIYDPVSYSLLDVRATFSDAIAVDAAGNMYRGDFGVGPVLEKYSPAGILLGSLALPGPVTDIEVSSTGTIAAGTGLGFDGVLLTDTEFSFSSTMATGNGPFLTYTNPCQYLFHNPGEALSGDCDMDGLADNGDNCSAVPNPAQIDADADGIGNLCDADFDNDCQTIFPDLYIMRAGFFGNNPVLDLDSSGGPVNFTDLSIMKDLFFMAPGPSGVANDCE